MKTITVVYQDCPMCGARRKWGEKAIKEAKTARAIIRKVSFVSREGEQLCGQAVLNGVKHMPFVTDGTFFAYDVKSLIEMEKEAKKTTRKAKRNSSKKKKAEVTDEPA